MRASVVMKIIEAVLTAVMSITFALIWYWALQPFSVPARAIGVAVAGGIGAYVAIYFLNTLKNDTIHRRNSIFYVCPSA